MNTADVISKLRSFDLETYLIRTGRIAPRIVCGSWASFDDSGTHAEIGNSTQALDIFEEWINKDYVIAGANLAFDLATCAQARPHLMPAIFQALAESRIFDLLIAESLHAIYNGTLGLDPRTGGDLRHPGSRKVTKRYSLEVVSDIVLGRSNAKQHDTWRTSYALLDGFPIERWPFEAVQYPKDDAVNSLEVALAQLGAGGGTPHENLGNLGPQCEFAFAAHLGAAWSLRTDRERVEALAAKVEKQHEDAVKRFQKLGWVRPDGTEDQISIKRSVALAYGASGACSRCEGRGTVPNIKRQDCRGEKVKGRFQGCAKHMCMTCGGAGLIDVQTGVATCKGSDGGCDGTGLDLKTAPYLPRSDKGGVRCDRDTLMESGDEELAAFGEDEFEKARTTFVPYLRLGTETALKIVPNVLVASGRCSYEGSPFHQFSRSGGIRECVRARGDWSGSPIAYVISSTDYEAGELSALAQFTYWVLGHSRMRDAINESGKPGILHSELAAEVLGIPIDEFLVRLKSKDKQCVDFRQASKPISFGKPGAMGSAKLVWTSRKKNAGFTPCEQGPAVEVASDGTVTRGYYGIRFCILVGGAERCGTTKINEWKGRPTFPVCKHCVDVVENVLTVSYFRRFPEIKEYFRWVNDRMKVEETEDESTEEPTDIYLGKVPCLVYNHDKGEVEVIRWRGGVTFPAACNNGFQAMLADVGKKAFVQMTKEGYIGTKPDGSPSPLAGSRFPVFMHDEPIGELPLATAHLAGPRIAEIMMSSGKSLAPDVVWKAETAISYYLNKGMEPVYVDGKLVPWEPKKKN